VKKHNFDSIDELLVVIPDGTKKKDIEDFVNTVHKHNALVVSLAPVNNCVSVKERIDSIMLFVSSNGLDGIAVNSAEPCKVLKVKKR